MSSKIKGELVHASIIRGKENERCICKHISIELTGRAGMGPDRAWETVLDQLENEMDKAAFETWVRDTWVVDFEKDMLTIGVTDLHARDWLENRISSFASRTLSGILGRPIHLRFAYAPEATMDGRDHGHVSDDEIPIPRVELVESLRNAFVKPGQAHVAPAYVLRWVPYLPSTAFWIWMGYRQAYFDHYHSAASSLKPFNVSSRKIADIVGIDRKTIESHREKEWFNWFLTFESTERYIFKDGTVTRDSFPYTFVSVAPPTPGDHDRLIEWLTRQRFDRNPISVLEQLLQTPVAEILGDPPPKPSAVQKRREPRELTFSKAILEECDLSKLSEDEIQQVIQLANTAESYIIDSFGLLYIPLYFMSHWVRTLKATPALAVTIIRHATGYYNPKTQEIRNSAVLRGGMESLSKKLGLSTDSIRRFLVTCQTRPPKDENEVSEVVLSEKKRKETARNTFTEFVEVEKVFDSGDLKLKLSMIDPLHPDDQVEYEAAIFLISKFLKAVGKECSENQIALFIRSLKDYGFFGDMKDTPNGNMKVSPIEDMKDSPIRNIKLSPKVDVKVYPNGEMKLSSNGDMKDSPIRETKDSSTAASERNESFTQLKYFNHLSANTLSDYLVHITNNRILTNTTKSNGKDTNLSGEPQLDWIVNAEGEWDVAGILKYSGLNSGKIQQIHQTVSGRTLVSYILYVFGPEKDSFNAPWQFIKSRLLAENPDMPIPGKVSFLSKLSPQDLGRLMQETSENWAGALEMSEPNLPGADIWNQYLRTVDSIHTIYEMAEILGLAEWV